MKAGKASVVTDPIERFDAAGIQLKSGKHREADIIITAAGLKLAVAGKIPVRVDGAPVDWHDHYYYKACMFSNVQNFSAVFGRSEEHTSELQSLMRISYAVFCLKKKNTKHKTKLHSRDQPI